jgi:hypothetical protein
MAKQNVFMQMSNNWTKWLLTSPLHGLASGSTLLVSVTGRKTGKTITTPVNYIRMDDGYYTLSSRDRIWWRNLRGDNGCCILWLKGIETPSSGNVYETTAEVVDALRKYIQASPFAAGYLKVRRDASGTLNDEDLMKAAESRVVIRFVPAEEAA